MKKISIFIFILLVTVTGMLWFVKRRNYSKTEQVAGEKIVQQDEVKLTFLDIGQGDATFIKFSNGEQMLVDCSEDARILEALGRVMPYYDHNIDYLMVTHPDSDHYGGCQDVLERFDIAHIVYTGFKKENDSRWDSLLQAIDAEKAQYHEIKSEDVWNIASTTLHFFYPDHPLAFDPSIPGYAKEVGPNNTSIVFSLAYASSSILMTGDAEETLEKYLLATYADQLDTDVIKLGHHGSDSSSIQQFLDMVTPTHAIASAGLNNKFGHPSRRVLKRLERASSTVWRTDLQGDIILRIGIDGINILDNSPN